MSDLIEITRIRTLPKLAALILGASLIATHANTAHALCEKIPPDPNQRYGVYSLQVENDLFTGTDAQYTNGVKAIWVSPNVTTFADPHLPCWMQHLNGTVEQLFGVLGANENKSRNMVVTFGQAMFTPADRERVSVDPNDRPYAGWTYLGLGYNARYEPPAVSEKVASMDTIEIDFGIVGPHAYAQQTQDAVHRARGFPLFQGWANQLRDEPGLQFVREQKLRPPSLHWKGDWGAEAIPHYGFSVGNIASYINAGVELRAGWRLPDDFGTSPIRPGGDNAAPLSGTPDGLGFRALSLHVFVSLDGRAVANNIFLDGNTWRESHAVKKHILVGDASYGWALTWPPGGGLPGGKLAYAHYVQTREFYGEEHNHGYGSVTLSLEF